MTSERWLPIPGHEGYEVSDFGSVRSVDRWITQVNGVVRLYKGQVLRDQPFPRTGHRVVSLKRNSTRKICRVHTLVMLAFVGPRPTALQVCHNNGDPADNRLTNLRYDTASSNVRDSVIHGTQRNTRKTHCKNGHEFTEDNTMILQQTTGPSRRCRTCRRAATRAWVDRQRAAIARLAS